MAVNKLYKFRRIEDVVSFLNGGIVGGSVNVRPGAPSNHGQGVQGLVGKTLIFTSPSAVTVTFAVAASAGGPPNDPYTNDDPYTLLFKDIKAQIQAAIPAVLVTLNADGQLVLTEVTPTSGVAVTGAGTANTALGFDAENGSTGKVYKPAAVSNTAPCWTWAYSGNDNMHNVYTWE